MPSHQQRDSECIRDTRNGNPTGIVIELCIEIPVFWFPLYQILILDISQILKKKMLQEIRPKNTPEEKQIQGLSF